MSALTHEQPSTLPDFPGDCDPQAHVAYVLNSGLRSAERPLIPYHYQELAFCILLTACMRKKMWSDISLSEFREITQSSPLFQPEYSIEEALYFLAEQNLLEVTQPGSEECFSLTANLVYCILGDSENQQPLYFYPITPITQLGYATPSSE